MWFVNNAISTMFSRVLPRRALLATVTRLIMPECSVPTALNVTARATGLLPTTVHILVSPMRVVLASITVEKAAVLAIHPILVRPPVPNVMIVTTLKVTKAGTTTNPKTRDERAGWLAHLFSGGRRTLLRLFTGACPRRVSPKLVAGRGGSRGGAAHGFLRLP